MDLSTSGSLFVRNSSRSGRPSPTSQATGVHISGRAAHTELATGRQPSVLI